LSNIQTFVLNFEIFNFCKNFEKNTFFCQILKLSIFGKFRNFRFLSNFENLNFCPIFNFNFQIFNFYQISKNFIFCQNFENFNFVKFWKSDFFLSKFKIFNSCRIFKKECPGNLILGFFCVHCIVQYTIRGYGIAVNNKPDI